MVPPRRPSPPPTRPPPPPDPLDAADYHWQRAQRHAAEFRYTEENDEPSTATGQHPPINLTVRVERESSHEIAPVPASEDHGKKANPGGLVAAIILLASSLAAICKALGWL